MGGCLTGRSWGWVRGALAERRRLGSGEIWPLVAVLGRWGSVAAGLLKWVPSKE